MDKKIIDLAFGELSSATVLKTHLSLDSNDFNKSSHPLQSGDDFEYGNYILVNYKDINAKIYNGMQMNNKEDHSVDPEIDKSQRYQHLVKIYDQKFFDKTNCFNFMSSNNVKSQENNLQTINRTTFREFTKRLQSIIRRNQSNLRN